MSYIKGLIKPEAEACFLCAAAAATSSDDRRNRLILWQTDHTIVLMNRYPYSNGHLMVAPLTHDADLDAISAAVQTDLVAQTSKVVRLLRRAVSAQGFNVGINLGRCAGAGVPGHLHQHIVPRWAGDTSFIHVVGETRIVPESLSQMYAELMRVAGELGIGVPS